MSERITITDAELRKRASPVVVETSDAIRSIYSQLKGEPLDVVSAVYKMLLMGSVGVLKQAAQSNRTIAANLRAYADMIEKESP